MDTLMTKMTIAGEDKLPPPPPDFVTSPTKFSTPMSQSGVSGHLDIPMPTFQIPPPPPEEDYGASLTDVSCVSDHDGTLTLDASTLGIGKTSRLTEVKELTCRCFSPKGDATDLSVVDNPDGTYTLKLIANEPGLYIVEAEWGGETVRGSPFRVKVMQHPEKKKVRVYGPGLDSGLLECAEGMFLVDTTAPHRLCGALLTAMSSSPVSDYVN